MNKANLVEEVANQRGLAKRASWEAVDATISVVTDTFARGDKITLVRGETLARSSFREALKDKL